MRWWSALLLASAGANAAGNDLSSHTKWSMIELTFQGPDSQGLSADNPFAVAFDAEFLSPSGQRHLVPGFYDGNGDGEMDGNVWKVRFSADEVGSWSYRSSSDEPRLNEKAGRFLVTPIAPDAVGFWRWGRLDAQGNANSRQRYLKFRDGPFWLKAGCDDPENFLGTYRHYDSIEKRKAAVDYLAQRGVNSLYVITHNIGGDDNDVWPWHGDTPPKAKAHGTDEVRFDVKKLGEWNDLFHYMQTAGIVPYLVLEDDSAWKGFDRERYYREMIARFGYLPALTFNCAEEHNENYSLSSALGFMSQLQKVDPFGHPRGIHNVNQPNNQYIDAQQVDFTSIQTGSPGSRSGLEKALEHNAIAIKWIERCVERNQRLLVVNFDEARPEEDRRCWWSVYLAGGV